MTAKKTVVTCVVFHPLYDAMKDFNRNHQFITKIRKMYRTGCSPYIECSHLKAMSHHCATVFRMENV